MKQSASIAIVVAIALCAGIVRADSAKDILDATGIRGGLVVHLGCGDGKLTAALRANDSYVVHGLDREARNVKKAREYIRSLGLYGSVSVDRLRGDSLPYADNLVNLLVAEELGEVPMREVRRALAPNGVAYVKIGGEWVKNAKPWPDDIDEWTHWLHGPDGNAVAQDRVVGPPRHIQWTAAPLWSRHHDTVPSTTAMVSANGRVFYISDEAPACLEGSVPDKWFLVARDAFNGVLLWKRPIREWGWNQWSAEWKGRFNEPPQLPKRLVAVGDRVYVTLGFNAPLTALDASTGETVRAYEGSERTDEILYSDGLLVLSVNQEARTPSRDDRSPVRKSVCVIDAESGRTLWKKGDYAGLRAKFNTAEPFGRLELAVGDGRVFLADEDAIVSLDLASGEESWRVARPAFEEHTVGYGIRMSDQCVLVYHGGHGSTQASSPSAGVVLFAQPEMKRARSWHTLPGRLHAYRASDGSPLWTHQYGGWAHNWQPDVFVIDGLVWLHEHQDVPFEGHEPKNKDEIDYAVIGLDLATGEVKRRFSTSKTFNVGHHHRCYRGKATERFLLPSRRGVEFLDLATEENHLHHWVRGACLYGIMPCNGLLYLTPHPCECYIATKLNGYYALAPARAAAGAVAEGLYLGEEGGGAAPRVPGYSRAAPQGRGYSGGTESTSAAPEAFERGPAYGRIEKPGSQDTDPLDWPTFRHDALRSGATSGSVPAKLERAWQSRVAGRLSPPVVAGGKLFVSSIDEHRVVALDATDGEQAWSFVAGGRVDTPPTVCGELVLFGSADGWVYCLREADGELVWRRRAAPEERLVGAFDQLESAWPVHGSVLVKDGVAYLAAGRSSYLDGGIVLYALDTRTGDVLKQQVLYSPDPATGEMPPGDARTIPGALADILVSDGDSIYMRQEQVLGGVRETPSGNVSATPSRGVRETPSGNVSRTPSRGEAGAGAHLLATGGFRDDAWFNRTQWAIGAVNAAQLVVFDDQMACGVAAYPRINRTVFFNPGGEGYVLFAREWKSRRSREAGDGSNRSWESRVPVRVTAMALARETLVAAGPPDIVDPQDPLGAFEGHKGGRLWLVATAGGGKLAEHQLDSPPVSDGLAVANERVYLSTQDGSVLCMAALGSDLKK
jgi:outer membrane protein assembly factor BamB/SAM-dependent methyltransferase